jgi:hypothetical protein
MRSKVGIVIVGTALTTFLLGRVEGVAQHRGSAGSVASAQEGDEQLDGPANDGSSQQDDAADVPDIKTGPATGVYSGMIVDDNLGTGKISGSITQLKSKLIGTWIDDFEGPGFLNGTIKSNGQVTAKFRLHIKGDCTFTFHGTFENGNEIAGTYNRAGCKGAPDGGNLDIIKN